jgi:hypothetical protein
MSAKFKRIPSGSIVKIIDAPDQSTYIKRKYVGLSGIIIQNTGPEDGVHSSKSIYKIQLESGEIHSFHFLDLEIISWNEL